MRAFLLIAILGSIPLIVLPFAAVPEALNYRYSFLFLVPIVWGVLAVRRRLHLHPVHYGLFVLALCLHNLGARGTYRSEFWGLAFDTYVHFFFGFVGALILERAFRIGRDLRGWSNAIATMLFLLGMGAIHELVEYGSTVVLGNEMGMLKVGNPDEFDTQKDLLNNLLGGLTALGVSAAYARSRSART